MCVCICVCTDARTCNGVVPHPFAPVLGSYGIDSHAKLWAVRTPDDVDVDEDSGTIPSTSTVTATGRQGRQQGDNNKGIGIVATKNTFVEDPDLTRRPAGLMATTPLGQLLSAKLRKVRFAAAEKGDRGGSRVLSTSKRRFEHREILDIYDHLHADLVSFVTKMLLFPFVVVFSLSLLFSLTSHLPLRVSGLSFLVMQSTFSPCL